MFVKCNNRFLYPNSSRGTIKLLLLGNQFLFYHIQVKYIKFIVFIKVPVVAFALRYLSEIPFTRPFLLILAMEVFADTQVIELLGKISFRKLWSIFVIQNNNGRNLIFVSTHNSMSATLAVIAAVPTAFVVILPYFFINHRIILPIFC